jgi:hypothetical protein
MNPDELKLKLADRNWRLNNLYYIVDKQGNKTKFEMTWAQKALLNGLWFLNIILKARQLGISTFVVIFMLDMCLFNSNTSAGIVDATLPDAKKKLKKARFAYDHLADDFPKLRAELMSNIQLKADNTQQLEFSNGSSIYADTTFRGDTVQVLHISEYAKICKTEPIKAEEVKTGALNAVAPGQFVFIESTAEGADGDFFDKCRRAELLQKTNVKLTKLDYKFFFFPWYHDPNYRLDKPREFTFSKNSNDYFHELELQDIALDIDQKFWYVKKMEDQGGAMRREFPATAKEAFEASDDDKYYKNIMLELRGRRQVCEFPVEQGIEVNTFWDLGRGDYNSIVFVQFIGKEIRVIDFIEDSGEELGFYIQEVKSREYLWGRHYLPHDARAARLEAQKSTEQRMIEAFGISHVTVLPAMDKDIVIDEVRRILPRCWFRTSTTTSDVPNKPSLVEHLENYRKKWSALMGVFVGPMHDEHSHASDAFGVLAIHYREPTTNTHKKQQKKRVIMGNPRRGRL